MKYKSLIIALLGAIIFSYPIKAQTTTKALLTNAVQRLNLLHTDTLKPGTTTYLLNGNKVAVRINSLNKLDHVGIPVFPTELKKLNPSPVYDFLEYALLDNIFTINSKSLIYKYVVFEKGDWKSLTSLPTDAECIISCTDNKYYNVTWQRGSEILASVKFPKQYDILALSNKQEMENLFIYQLQATEGKTTNHALKTITDDTFSKEYENDKIQMLKGLDYVSKSLSTNLFYIKKGKAYILFSQTRHPAESLANILLTADSRLPKTMVTANVIKYDGTKETVDFEIADLIDYVKSQGGKLYYGFDKIEGNTANAILLASNPAAGYDHVFHLQCELGQLDDHTVHLKGTINLFAPTTNVKDLFYKYDKK